MPTPSLARRRRSLAILSAAATAAALLPLPASAQFTRYYVGGGLNWNTPSSWSDNPAGPPGSFVPSNNDIAYLTAAVTVPFDGYYNSPGLATLYVDNGANLSLSPALDARLLAATEYIGYSSSGTLSQSAQTNILTTNLTLGYNPGSAGTYSLSGGVLSPNGGEYLGYHGAGTFVQTGGTHTVSMTYGIAANTGSSGTYSLSGTGLLSVASDEYLGSAGPGIFYQSGGSHVIAGSFNLAFNNYSSGYYSLSNAGALSVAGTEYLGYQSSGIFAQSGGTHDVTGSLRLGIYGYAYGSYSLSGGALSVHGAESVGSGAGSLAYGVTGSFTQSGGTHTVAGTLYLGDDINTTGTYSLSGAGSLSASSEVIGHFGIGTFVQTGGSNAVATSLSIGYGGAGLYSLSGAAATLSVAGSEYIGGGSGAAGTFVQTGGTHTAPYLQIRPAGLYHLVGGTLSISQGLALQGTLDCSPSGGTATPTLSATSGILDLSAGTLANTSPLTVTGSPNSLVLFPAGFDPATELAAYDNPGVTGYADGSPVTIPAGTDIVGVASLPVHLNVSGSLARPAVGAAAPLNLNAGVSVLPGGSVAASSLAVDDATSSLVDGGTLTVSTAEYVGKSGAGTFTQTGGTHSLSQAPNPAGYGARLILGSAAGATGTYSLSGDSATLLVGTEYVGAYGAGTFLQSGGTHKVAGTLSIPGGQGNGPGSYTLSGGSLSAAKTTIRSNGSLSYTGGSASLGALTLSGTAQLLLSPGHDKTLLASTLSVASTARLDLADDTLSLSATSADSVRSYLAAGSLLSSAADASHRLGYLDSGSAVTVQLALSGDANLDGQITPDDYALLDRGYATGGAYWWQGDFNYDGQVDQQDYLLIDTTLGQTQGFSPGFLAARESQFGAGYVSALLAAVPEPASLGLIGLAVLATRRRRFARVIGH